MHPLNPSEHGGPLVVRGYLLFVRMCLLMATALLRNWPIASMHAFTADSSITLVCTKKRVVVAIWTSEVVRMDIGLLETALGQ